MNPAPESDDWLDAVRSRSLPPGELERLRQTLASRPRERHRLEEELALNEALDSLPRLSASSNFLAQIEARITREDRATVRSFGTGWRWLTGLHLLRPLAAMAVAAVAVGGWWQFRVHQRVSLATNLAAVSQAAGMSGIESLRDFEAVQLLRTTAQPGDVELLAVLDAEAPSVPP